MDMSEAEVDELEAEGSALVAEDHEVGGLEVAVDDADAVDGVEGGGALGEEAEGEAGVEEALAGGEPLSTAYRYKADVVAVLRG